MMYGKLINGTLEIAPQNYKLEDGRMITNFNTKPMVMQKYGFKELVIEKPDYDSELQELYIDSCEENENEDNIVVIYRAERKENYSIEERVANLEQVDTEHEEALMEIMDALMETFMLGGEDMIEE